MFNIKLEFLKELITNIGTNYTVQEISVTERGYFEISVIPNDEYDDKTLDILRNLSYIENIDKDTEKFLGHMED